MASKKKVTGGKRPQNLRRTLGQFSAYLGRHRIMIGLVALLAAISALAALFGTYMIRPVVNGLLENGSKAYLAGAVGLTACIYIIGALSTLGYTQLMVRAAQKVLQERGGGHKKVISYFLRNGVASVTPLPVSAVLPRG